MQRFKGGWSLYNPCTDPENFVRGVKLDKVVFVVVSRLIRRGGGDQTST